MAKQKINPSKQPHPQPQTQHSQIVSQAWSGPLPPPAALAQFNDIIPNGADRIMLMIEREQEHRLRYDDTMLTAARSDIKRGHLIGATLCALALGGAVVTAYLGAAPSVSIALVGIPVLGMIKAFLPGKSKSDK